jgi:hypothetical protein
MGQVLSWALFIGPWFILFFLNKRKMKHFLSVMFFEVAIDTINFQIAQYYKWWVITDNVWFLTSTCSFAYGLLPVTTLLVFYYFYPKPLLFFGANLVMDAFQAFVVCPFVFEAAGLYRMENMSNFGLLVLIYSMVPILYLYQRLYDRARSKKDIPQ